MLRCQFLCHVLKTLFSIKIALKLSYFAKKCKIFERWGLRPQSPVPPAAGGFAPRLPASSSWGLSSQTPIGLRRLGALPPDPQTAPPLRISGYAPVLCHDNGMTAAKHKYHTVSLLNCDVFRIF